MSKPKQSCWIVTYDVVNDKRRNKVAALMEDYGIRIQYSVFECILTHTELKCLRDKLTPLYDATEDSIRFYPLCSDCATNVIRFGKQACFENQAHAFVL